MGIEDSTDKPLSWAWGNIHRYIAKQWKILAALWSLGWFGALWGIVYDGGVGEVLRDAPLVVIGIAGFGGIGPFLVGRFEVQRDLLSQIFHSMFRRAARWGAEVGVLFPLALALVGGSLLSLVIGGVGGGGLLVGLFLFGTGGTWLYFWRERRRYSFSGGRRKYGGVVSWQVFLLGLFFAMLGSFMYHQLDGSLSIWVIGCLWLGLSLWLGLCKHRAITGAFPRMAAFQKNPVVERGKPRLRPICVLSAIGGMVGSVVFWVRTLIRGSPFDYAMGAVYHSLKAFSTWETPQLLLGLSIALHFIWGTALPALASPWAFIGMVGPAALYLRGYHQVQHWYQQATRHSSRKGWVLENLKGIAVRGALLINLVGFFLLVGGTWLGVSPFVLGPMLVFTLPFSLIYHLYDHPEYFNPADIQASSKRLTMMSVSSVVLVLLFMLTLTGSPGTAEAMVTAPFSEVDPTTFEGQLAVFSLDRFVPSSGGFKMSQVDDSVTLESTYYGVSILYRTGYQHLLADYRQPITAFILRQWEEGGGFGTLENTFYAIQTLKMLDALTPEVAEGAAHYLRTSTTGLQEISPKDLHAYSLRLGHVYQAIRLCRALGKPVSEIENLPVLGAAHVVEERAPQVYTTHLTATTTGGIEPVTRQVEVLDPVTLPLFLLAQEVPRVEVTVHFHLNETLNFALAHGGLVEETRTVDGRTTDQVRFSVPFPQPGRYSLSIERPDIMSLEFDNSTGTWAWEFVKTKLPTSLKITTFAPPYAIFPLPSAYEEFSLVVNATQPTELYLTEPSTGFQLETPSLSELDPNVEVITLEAPLAAEAVSSIQLLAGDYYLIAFSSEPSTIVLEVQETEALYEPSGITLHEGEPLVQFTEGLTEYSSPEELLMLTEVYQSISEPGFFDMVYDRERVRRELMKFYNRNTYLFEDTGHIEDAFYGFLAYENLLGDVRSKYEIPTDRYGRYTPKMLAGPERSLISGLRPAERALSALHQKWMEAVNLTSSSLLDGLAFRPREGLVPNLKATYCGLMVAERLGTLQKMYYTNISPHKIAIRQPSRIASGTMVGTRRPQFSRIGDTPLDLHLESPPSYRSASTFIPLMKPALTEDKVVEIRIQIFVLALMASFSLGLPLSPRHWVMLVGLGVIGIFLMNIPAMVVSVGEWWHDVFAEIKDAKDLLKSLKDTAIQGKSPIELLAGKVKDIFGKTIKATLVGERLLQPITSVMSVHVEGGTWATVVNWLDMKLRGWGGGQPFIAAERDPLPEDSDSTSRTLQPQRLRPQSVYNVKPVQIDLSVLMSMFQQAGLSGEVQKALHQLQYEIDSYAQLLNDKMRIVLHTDADLNQILFSLADDLGNTQDEIGRVPVDMGAGQITWAQASEGLAHLFKNLDLNAAKTESGLLIQILHQIQILTSLEGTPLATLAKLGAIKWRLDVDVGGLSMRGRLGDAVTTLSQAFPGSDYATNIEEELRLQTDSLLAKMGVFAADLSAVPFVFLGADFVDADFGDQIPNELIPVVSAFQGKTMGGIPIALVQADPTLSESQNQGRLRHILEGVSRLRRLLLMPIKQQMDALKTEYEQSLLQFIERERATSAGLRSRAFQEFVVNLRQELDQKLEPLYAFMRVAMPYVAPMKFLITDQKGKVRLLNEFDVARECGASNIAFSDKMTSETFFNSMTFLLEEQKALAMAALMRLGPERQQVLGGNLEAPIARVLQDSKMRAALRSTTMTAEEVLTTFMLLQDVHSRTGFHAQAAEINALLGTLSIFTNVFDWSYADDTGPTMYIKRRGRYLLDPDRYTRWEIVETIQEAFKYMLPVWGMDSTMPQEVVDVSGVPSLADESSRDWRFFFLKKLVEQTILQTEVGRVSHLVYTEFLKRDVGTISLDEMRKGALRVPAFPNLPANLRNARGRPWIGITNIPVEYKGVITGVDPYQGEASLRLGKRGAGNELGDKRVMVEDEYGNLVPLYQYNGLVKNHLLIDPSRLAAWTLQGGRTQYRERPGILGAVQVMRCVGMKKNPQGKEVFVVKPTGKWQPRYLQTQGLQTDATRITDAQTPLGFNRHHSYSWEEDPDAPGEYKITKVLSARETLNILDWHGLGWWDPAFVGRGQGVRIPESSILYYGVGVFFVSEGKEDTFVVDSYARSRHSRDQRAGWPVVYVTDAAGNPQALGQRCAADLAVIRTSVGTSTDTDMDKGRAAIVYAFEWMFGKDDHSSNQRIVPQRLVEIVENLRRQGLSPPAIRTAIEKMVEDIRTGEAVSYPLSTALNMLKSQLCRLAKRHARPGVSLEKGYGSLLLNTLGFSAGGKGRAFNAAVKILQMITGDAIAADGSGVEQKTSFRHSALRDPNVLEAILEAFLMVILGQERAQVFIHRSKPPAGARTIHPTHRGDMWDAPMAVVVHVTQDHPIRTNTLHNGALIPFPHGDQSANERRDASGNPIKSLSDDPQTAPALTEEYEKELGKFQTWGGRTKRLEIVHLAVSTLKRMLSDVMGTPYIIFDPEVPAKIPVDQIFQGVLPLFESLFRDPVGAMHQWSEIAAEIARTDLLQTLDQAIRTYVEHLEGVPKPSEGGISKVGEKKLGKVTRPTFTQPAAESLLEIFTSAAHRLGVDAPIVVMFGSWLAAMYAQWGLPPTATMEALEHSQELTIEMLTNPDTLTALFVDFIAVFISHVHGVDLKDVRKASMEPQRLFQAPVQGQYPELEGAFTIFNALREIGMFNMTGLAADWAAATLFGLDSALHLNVMQWEDISGFRGGAIFDTTRYARVTKELTEQNLFSHGSMPSTGFTLTDENNYKFGAHFVIDGDKISGFGLKQFHVPLQIVVSPSYTLPILEWELLNMTDPDRGKPVDKGTLNLYEIIGSSLILNDTNILPISLTKTIWTDYNQEYMLTLKASVEFANCEIYWLASSTGFSEDVYENVAMYAEGDGVPEIEVARGPLGYHYQFLLNVKTTNSQISGRYQSIVLQRIANASAGWTLETLEAEMDATVEGMMALHPELEEEIYSFDAMMYLVSKYTQEPVVAIKRYMWDGPVSQPQAAQQLTIPVKVIVTDEKDPIQVSYYHYLKQNLWTIPVSKLTNLEEIAKAMVYDAQMYREIIVLAPNAQLPAALLATVEGRSILKAYLEKGNGLIVAGSSDPLLEFTAGGFPAAALTYETGDEFPGSATYTVNASNYASAIAQQLNFTEPTVFGQLNVLLPETFDKIAKMPVYLLANLTQYNSTTESSDFLPNVTIGMLSFQDHEGARTMSVNPDFLWGIVSFPHPVAVDAGVYWLVIENNATQVDWTVPLVAETGLETRFFRNDTLETPYFGTKWSNSPITGDLIVRTTVEGTSRYDPWTKIITGPSIMDCTKRIVHATTKAGMTYESWAQVDLEKIQARSSYVQVHTATSDGAWADMVMFKAPLDEPNGYVALVFNAPVTSFEISSLVAQMTASIIEGSSTVQDTMSSVITAGEGMQVFSDNPVSTMDVLSEDYDSGGYTDYRVVTATGNVTVLRETGAIWLATPNQNLTSPIDGFQLAYQRASTGYTLDSLASLDVVWRGAHSVTIQLRQADSSFNMTTDVSVWRNGEVHVNRRMENIEGSSISTMDWIHPFNTHSTAFAEWGATEAAVGLVVSESAPGITGEEYAVLYDVDFDEALGIWGYQADDQSSFTVSAQGTPVTGQHIVATVPDSECDFTLTETKTFSWNVKFGPADFITQETGFADPDGEALYAYQDSSGELTTESWSVDHRAILSEAFSNETLVFQTWVNASGSWVVENGTLTREDSTGEGIIYLNQTVPADLSFSFVTNITTKWAGWIVYGSFATDGRILGGYQFHLRSNDSALASDPNALKVEKWNGTAWEEASLVPLDYNVSVGELHAITTELHPGSITVYVNGANVTTFTDTTYTSGFIGFRLYGDRKATFNEVRLQHLLPPFEGSDYLRLSHIEQHSDPQTESSLILQTPVAYTVRDDSYLTVAMYVDPESSDAYAGVDLHFTDNTSLSDYSITDQFGFPVGMKTDLSTVASGAWYRQWIDLSLLESKTIAWLEIGHESETADTGSWVIFYDGIQIVETPTVYKPTMTVSYLTDPDAFLGPWFAPLGGIVEDFELDPVGSTPQDWDLVLGETEGHNPVPFPLSEVTSTHTWHIISNNSVCKGSCAPIARGLPVTPFNLSDYGGLVFQVMINSTRPGKSIRIGLRDTGSTLHWVNISAFGLATDNVHSVYLDLTSDFELTTEMIDALFVSVGINWNTPAELWLDNFRLLPNRLSNWQGNEDFSFVPTTPILNTTHSTKHYYTTIYVHNDGDYDFISEVYSESGTIDVWVNGRGHADSQVISAGSNESHPIHLARGVYDITLRFIITVGFNNRFSLRLIRTDTMVQRPSFEPQFLHPQGMTHFMQQDLRIRGDIIGSSSAESPVSEFSQVPIASDDFDLSISSLFPSIPIVGVIAPVPRLTRKQTKKREDDITELDDFDFGYTDTDSPTGLTASESGESSSLMGSSHLAPQALGMAELLALQSMQLSPQELQPQDCPSCGLFNMTGDWAEAERSQTSIIYYNETAPSQRMGRFGLSLVNEGNETTPDWKLDAEVPLELVLRKTNGMVQRFNDPDAFLTAITSDPTALWGFGIRNSQGVRGFFVDASDVKAHAQYITIPRYPNGSLFPVEKPLTSTYVRLWAKENNTWYQTFLTNKNLFISAATDPRRNVVAVNRTEGDDWYLEVGYNLTGVEIQGETFNYYVGLRVYRKTGAQGHLKAEVTCTTRDVDDVGVEYVLLETPAYRTTEWHFATLTTYSYNATSNQTQPAQSFALNTFTDTTVEVPDYVQAFDLTTQNGNASLHFDFEDLKAANFTTALFRVENITLPWGGWAWVARVGMYGRGAWAANTTLEIDPSSTIKIANNGYDGSVKHYYWGYTGWSPYGDYLKVENVDNTYHWFAWLSFNLGTRLSTAYTVSSLKLNPYFDHENIEEGGDPVAIKAWKHNGAVGDGGSSGWNTGQNIYNKFADNAYTILKDKYGTGAYVYITTGWHSGSEGFREVSLQTRWMNEYWLDTYRTGYFTVAIFHDQDFESGEYLRFLARDWDPNNPSLHPQLKITWIDDTAPAQPVIENLDGGVANGTSTADQSPRLDWVFSDPDAQDQNKIELEVNTQPDFSGTVMWNFTPSSHAEDYVDYNGSALQDGQTYYWKVRVYDGILWSNWSLAYSFLIDLDQPNKPAIEAMNLATDEWLVLYMKVRDPLC